MRSALGTVFAIMVFSLCQTASAQDSPVALSYGTRWILNTQYGSLPLFGVNSAATSFGPAVEHSISNTIEVQANLSVTPSVAVNATTTSTGHSFGLGGAGIGWINERLGLSLGVQQSWLWASKFSASAWNPSLGMVLRDYFHRPGRLYVSYLFPTGCSGGSSCPTPLSRMQGVQSMQEFRLWRHFRLGLQGGVYHFCSEGAPPDQRTCKFSPAGLVVMRFEFSNADATTPY